MKEPGSTNPAMIDWALKNLDVSEGDQEADRISKAKTNFLVRANASGFHVTDERVRSVMVLCGKNAIIKDAERLLCETNELDEISGLLVAGFSHDFDCVVATLTSLSSSGFTARVKKRAAHALRAVSTCHQPLAVCSSEQRVVIEAFAIVAVTSPMEKNAVRSAQIERIRSSLAFDASLEAAFITRYPDLIALDATLHRTLFVKEGAVILHASTRGLASKILDGNQSGRVVSRDSYFNPPNSYVVERTEEREGSGIQGWHIFVGIWLVGVVAKVFIGFSDSDSSTPVRPDFFPQGRSTDAFRGPNRGDPISSNTTAGASPKNKKQKAESDWDRFFESFRNGSTLDDRPKQNVDESKSSMQDARKIRDWLDEHLKKP